MIEKKHPELVAHYGHMDVKLMRMIACQIPEKIVVHLHNNGEPTLYPELGHAIRTFERQITHFDTNGKLLLVKAAEIIGHLDCMAVSIIESDNESEQQYLIVKEFLELKQDQKPLVTLRMNGDVYVEKYEGLINNYQLNVASRTLHSPMGSFEYRRRPTVPELGVCWDFLHHLSIDKDGRVSPCVRFDPYGEHVIGDANIERLEDIWNGTRRQEWLKLHLKGRRDKIPLCKKCEYWGVPIGKD
jgi:radical SAM protein with 4Fe4S-binding SPASM domain